jgi:hypothetical protein
VQALTSFSTGQFFAPAFRKFSSHLHFIAKGLHKKLPVTKALCFIEPQQNQYINFNGKT